MCPAGLACAGPAGRLFCAWNPTTIPRHFHDNSPKKLPTFPNRSKAKNAVLPAQTGANLRWRKTAKMGSSPTGGTAIPLVKMLLGGNFFLLIVGHVFICADRLLPPLPGTPTSKRAVDWARVLGIWELNAEHSRYA